MKRVGEENESNVRIVGTFQVQSLVLLQKYIFREAKKYLSKLNGNCIGSNYNLSRQSRQN